MTSAPGPAGKRTLSAPDVDALDTDPVVGLTDEEAQRRLAAFGPNEVVATGTHSWLSAVARQSMNTMTVVLALAMVVSLIVGDVVDATAIAAIGLLNSVIGGVQSHRAERAISALHQLAAPTARVIRSGRARDLPAVALTPGDLVVLGVGDLVPADLALLEAPGLQVDESLLTGESTPVEKLGGRSRHGIAAGTESSEEDLTSLDRSRIAYAGTSVTSGRGLGLVTGIGRSTELGRIASLLQSPIAEVTPLQQRVEALGRQLVGVALAVCAVVIGFGVVRGDALHEVLLTAITLAVAAIPEGLPAVVTVALALGARRLADQHAIVRHLDAVETLGSVTVICADKTGTLTENQMMVEHVWTPAGVHDISGSGYAPEGEVDGGEADDAHLLRAARVAAACNDAFLVPPSGMRTAWSVTGDPTEGALLAFAARVGIDRVELLRHHPRIAEIGFTSELRRMTTFHRSDSGTWVAAKGALEAIEPFLDPRDRALVVRASTAMERFAAEGHRVLALADGTALPMTDDASSDPRHVPTLRLLGIVAIGDPPRPSAKTALATCRSAGITPVMITGDSVTTAIAIATRIELTGRPIAALTGDDLDSLSDDDLRRRIDTIDVFARVKPEQKLRIIGAWQSRGGVVAMTGDGVNDAPALRSADIGVAMGRIGTEVSREAADIVLVDDDIATIVAAVREGRRIFANIRRFVRYLVATNSGELALMLLAPIVGLPTPLLPTQILWINLITDGPPAVALGLEPLERDAMHEAPRPRSEGVLTHDHWRQALATGTGMGVAAIVLLAVTRHVGWPWQTMVFTTLAFLQLANAITARSRRAGRTDGGRRPTAWLWPAVALSAGAQLAAVYVPALQGVFSTTALDARQLAVVIGVSAIGGVALEILRRRFDPVSTPHESAEVLR